MEILYGLQLLGIIFTLISISSLRVISAAALAGSSYFLSSSVSFWSTAVIFSLTFHSTTDPLELLLFCSLFILARLKHPNFQQSILKLTIIWFFFHQNQSSADFRNSIIVLLTGVFSISVYSKPSSEVYNRTQIRPRFPSFQSQELERQGILQKKQTGSDISINSNFSIQNLIKKLRNTKKLRRLYTSNSVKESLSQQNLITPIKLGQTYQQHF